MLFSGIIYAEELTFPKFEKKVTDINIENRLRDIELNYDFTVTERTPNAEDIREGGCIFFNGVVRKRLYLKMDGNVYYITLDHRDRLMYAGNTVFFNGDIIFYEGN